MKKAGKILLTIWGLILVLPAVLTAAPGFCPWGAGPGWSHPMMFGGGMFMWIINLLILALAVFFIVKLLRNNPAVKGGEALEILKTRLAKGEITMEEYDTLKKEIS